MAEFKEIPPLGVEPDRQGLAAITCRGSLVRLYQTAWDLADARALYEWLGRALPCEHKRTFTGYVRVDPFGKSEAMKKVENQCLDCGHPYFTGSDAVKP